MEAEGNIIFFLSVLFTSTLFSLALFFGYKKVAYLLFSLYCVTHSIKLLVKLESVASILPFDMATHKTTVYYVIVIMGMLCLNAFLLYQYEFTHKRRYLAGFLSVAVVFFFTIFEGFFLYASIISAFYINVVAITRKKDGAWISLIGLVGLGVCTYLAGEGILTFGYFVGIMFFIFCMIWALSRQLFLQNKAHQEALTKSARLENELLKKNIQPHFIMNSLTSVQELLRDDPEQASEFIHSLAEEFEVFARISGDKLIAFEDEKKLIQSHLKIMEFRKGMRFTFTTEGMDGNELIPPGIFHTLVENGLTHGYSGRYEGTFKLSKHPNGKKVTYEFFNDSQCVESSGMIKKGTGIKYIEARLEESFPGGWNINSGPVDNGWHTSIEIWDQNGKPWK
ncbi:MAG: histidine kinase [Bacteroidota bacterium]